MANGPDVGATTPRTDRARRNSGRRDDFLSLRDPRLGLPDGIADLGGIRPAVAGDEREHGLRAADEDERLHDLVEVAADRVCGSLRRRRIARELLEPRFGA